MLRNLHADGTAMDVNGRYYHQGDISEFIEESNHSIDWERRRYEIAKDVLAAQISDTEYAENNSEQMLAKHAVRYADALIEELKKKINESKS